MSWRARVLTATSLVAASMALSSCHLFDLAGHGARSAAIAWHVPGTSFGTPAFDGATAYFITTDHFVVALDAATGHERWRASTGTLGGAPDGFPLCSVVGPLVVCGDSALVALQRADGTLAWRYRAQQDEPGLYPFASAGATLFAGSHGPGTIYAIDGATGAERWTARVFGTDSVRVNIPKLVTDGDIVAAVFVRATNPLTGGAVAVDAATGALRWLTRFPQGAPDSTSAGISVALWNNSVVASSSDGKIYILDRVSGVVQSFFPGVGRSADVVGIIDPVGEDFRPIVVANSLVLAASTGSWLTAYDLVQHRELWRVVDPDGSTLGSPIVVDGDKVYITHFNGRLAAFSATAPKFLWDVGNFENAFAASPTVGPDKIFVAGITGFWAIKK